MNGLRRSGRGDRADRELTASPAIGDQLGCALIIGAAKC